MGDIVVLLQTSGTELIIKFSFLILEALYLIYCVIIANQVNSLNKLFFINPAHSSRMIQIISFAQVIFALALFILTLAIL